MAAGTWIVPQVSSPDVQHLSHWIPAHTLAQALKAHEKTACNLQVEQLVLGTAVQQSGKPPDNGRLCYGCSQR